MLYYYEILNFDYDNQHVIHSDSTNLFFGVMFESAVRIICSFSNEPVNQIKACSIAYGSYQQTPVTTMTTQSTISSDSTVVINLQSQISNGHCYTVTASNGALSTVKIQGVFSEYTPIKISLS